MKGKGAPRTSNHGGPVMTVREVSAYLKVNPSTVYRLLKRNRIPAFHVGSDWRFNVEVIDRWCLEREMPVD
jgi:excisionase family DNA binding protein